MSKGIQAKLDEVQTAVDRAGKALEDARKGFDEALAKLAQPPLPRRKKPSQ
jgi:hypothetical protein